MVQELREIAQRLIEIADSLSGNESAPTLEEVRAVLADISRAGHTAEMKNLLSRFGASKLSEVPESEYSALISAAKEVK